MIKIATWNCQGLTGKEDEIVDFVNANHIDILFVCETWRDPRSSPRPEGCLYSSSYPCRHKRATGKEGRSMYGVALYSKSLSSVNIIFENQGLDLIFEALGTLFFCIYLSPSLSMDECQARLFGPQASVFWNHQGPRILMGDLNTRLGKLTGDKMAKRLNLHHGLTQRGLILQNHSRLPPTINLAERGSSTPDLIYSSGSLKFRCRDGTWGFRPSSSPRLL